ncbi:hypothetical protein D3C73_1672530 [compost metagenome]
MAGGAVSRGHGPEDHAGRLKRNLCPDYAGGALLGDWFISFTLDAARIERPDG